MQRHNTRFQWINKWIVGLVELLTVLGVGDRRRLWFLMFLVLDIETLYNTFWGILKLAEFKAFIAHSFLLLKLYMSMDLG